LGYFSYYLTPQRAYYGGLLVVNSRGIPKEFRHTEAVKPTRLQTTLYGDSLEASLGMDALAPSLYDALTTTPDILLVDKQGRDLFGNFAYLHSPAALLVPLADPEMAFSDFLSIEGNLLEPMDYELKGSTNERLYAYINENAERPIGLQVLGSAQKRMNLFTPFDRVRSVLSEIGQVEQGRYQP
jgi:hypothetical protein